MTSKDKSECPEEISKPKSSDAHVLNDISLPSDHSEILNPSNASKFSSETHEPALIEVIEGLRTKCENYEVSVNVISFHDTMYISLLSLHAKHVAYNNSYTRFIFKCLHTTTLMSTTINQCTSFGS